MIRLSKEQRALAAPHARGAQKIAWSLTVISGMFHWHDVLRSTALEALSKAALAFDPSRNVPFDKFAWYRIVGAVKNEIGKEGRRLSLEGAVLDAAARIEDESPAHPDADDDTVAQLDNITEEIMAAFALCCAGHECRAAGEAGLLQRQAYAELNQAVAELAVEDRRLVKLRYWDDLPWKDVAEHLGVPERTAKDHDQKIRSCLGATLRSSPIPRPLSRDFRRKGEIAGPPV